MNKPNVNNNMVIAAGEIISDFEYSHTVYGEAFYSVQLKVYRTSGNYDLIPVLISDRLLDMKPNLRNTFLLVKGQYRSFNRNIDGKRCLVLMLFAKEVRCQNSGQDSKLNSVYLDGYLCRKNAFRVTPKGRKITDFMPAVNRTYGHSDYIPCICWGRTALYVSGLSIGSRVRIHGRIQSRDYQKKITEEQAVIRTAYEVSVSTLEKIEEEAPVLLRAADSSSVYSGGLYQAADSDHMRRRKRTIHYEDYTRKRNE